ncbi:hypothetical protein Moror_10847 [Moniliophthora roreri MCA 2997]|uniref:Xylanolytic transcriptional activator regulatory domain-containing protein n=1 Tax=Moniliophthora roreri (strain MCA 2997) TaxID=1381753 RepID=V2X2C3_MONRO|nr:hypothetical protein Moror_10847 [Moniliophthora roreri MCA 2997]
MEKKKRGSQRTRISRSLHETQKLVDSILSASKPFVVPRDTQTVHQLLVDLAHYARSLEQGQSASQLTMSRNTSPLPTGNEPAYSYTSSLSKLAGSYINSDVFCVEDDLDSFADKFNHLSLNHGAARHFGPSSALAFTQSIFALRQRIEGSSQRIPKKRPQFWHIYPWQVEKEEASPDYDFPEEDLLNELIDLFFKKINFAFPVLHRPVFEKCIKDNLHRQNRHFGATVLTLCAVASRYSDDSRVFDDPAEPSSAGWKYFRQIQLMRSTFLIPPTVYELQMYCIAMLFLYCTTTPEACWILLGHGVRCAQDLGIHRRPPGNVKPTMEYQLLNRVFWCFYVIDVILTMALGKPRAIHTEEYDVPLPLEVDDEYWEVEDPEDAFKQPVGKPCKMSFWISFLKLSDIAGSAQAMLLAQNSDVGMEWRERNIIEIDSRLNAWVDTIPDHLKWDPDREDPIFFHQSAILYTLYYWIQIHVHRLFTAPMQVASPFPSQVICTNAARSCCHILQAQNRKDFIVHPVSLNAAYISGIILYLNVETSKEMLDAANLNKEISNCYKCFECFGEWERRFQMAGYFRDILGEIFSDLPSHRQSSKHPLTELDADHPQFPDAATVQHNYQTPIPTQIPSGSAASGSVSTALAPTSLPIYSTDLANPPAQDVFHTPGYSDLDPYTLNVDWTAFDTSNSGPLTAGSSGTMEAQESTYMQRFIDECLWGPLGISDTWNSDPGWNGGNPSNSSEDQL